MHAYSHDGLMVLTISSSYALSWTEEWKLQCLKHFNPSHSEREGKAEQQGYPLKMPNKRNQKAAKILTHSSSNTNNTISRSHV
jgi:hypothetical protein